MTPLNVISPHRDDAAFSVGMTLSAIASRGFPCRVINCFTVSNFAPYGGSTDVEVVSGMRAAEDKEFTSRLRGSPSVIDLGRLDAPIRLGRHFTRVCTGGWLSGDDRAEVDEVSRLINLAAPVGALILPLAVGSHIDHRIAHAAGVRAGRNRVAGFYEELPYSISACHFETLIKVREAERRIHSSLLPVHIFSPDKETAKYDLISVYKSQLPPDELLRIAAYRPDGQNCERLWIRPDVAEAWQSAGLPLRLARRLHYGSLRLTTSVALFKAQGLARRGILFGLRVARLMSTRTGATLAR